ncbi:MAG: 3-hydroxyacyl-ACP dehydratase FabZ family protein [Planctomycetota bacterium]|jgi:3-hydroxyacyl-[acyl-carrier-protein] dehydratase|nr:3-hydroxyacyl-ACP dehydratase FabZ family protein [Planctomycetota bacterium]MDP7249259.1 3-hydroxyacyl-ACP dehydratase FabZ family protein [Planctomycetota bacterium]
MRYFLIDKVTELVVGERARGIKNITLSDEILHDHFPDYPIMPGALILESAAQLSGFLLEMTFNQPEAPPLRALLVQIQNAKFYETCGPGDQLDITVKLDSKLDAAAQVSAEVLRGETRVVRALLTFVMKDIPSEKIHEQRKSVYRLWTRDFETPVTIL